MRAVSWREQYEVEDIVILILKSTDQFLGSIHTSSTEYRNIADTIAANKCKPNSKKNQGIIS